MRAKKIANDASGIIVDINGVKMKFPFLADFQNKNTLAAVATVYSLGYSLSRIASVTDKLKGIPGRFELIDLGQDFWVIVDYAYEPYALRALLESVEKLNPKRIIGVHGSAGGGRDIARREKIGSLAAEKEDIVIVTNEDPYDEDPRRIIEMVADGARRKGKIEERDLFLVDDRQEAIDLAISLAEKGDAVILTGKGSEPVMAVGERKKIPWSDKEAAKKALLKKGYVEK